MFCTGSDCFRLTYLLEAGLAAGALVAAIVLWRRCQHLYDRVAAVTRDERGRRGLQVLRSPEVFQAAGVLLHRNGQGLGFV